MTTATSTSIKHETQEILTQLGVPTTAYTGGTILVRTPITGELIAQIPITTNPAKTIESAHKAFLEWRTIPAPRRGELIRLLGEELRAEADTLGRLVTIEVGKSSPKASAKSRR